MLTFEDLKPYVKELGRYDKLCIFDNKTDKLLDTIYINPKDNKLYEYYNIFISNELNDKYDRYYFFQHIKKDDCYFRVFPVEDWCAYKRKRNYDEFMKSKEDSLYGNAKLIHNQIKKDQGKYVKFKLLGDTDNDYMGFLVSVVASDEDYYYVYLQGGKLKLMTCVSGYIVDNNEEHINPFSDKEIGQMLYDRFEDKNSMDAVIYWGKYEI